MFGVKNLDPYTNLNTNAEKDFTGSGSISRSGNITATVPATVIKVLPNYNLYIEGQRAVNINKEQQLIKISGIIRPCDILADNSIHSTYIANASISYDGSGLISNKQEPGWLGKLFDKIWPL